MELKTCVRCNTSKPYSRYSRIKRNFPYNYDGVCRKCRNDMRRITKKRIFTDLENEFWVPVSDYEGCYEISNLSRIRSLLYSGPAGSFKRRTPWLMKPARSKNVYLTVVLAKDGVKTGKYLHILLADAFLPKEIGKNFINHVNGIKDDCRLENLERCTKSENSIHAFEHGLMDVKRGERNVRSKLTEEAVRCIMLSGDTNVALGVKFGVDATTISNVKNGRLWNHITGIPLRRKIKSNYLNVQTFDSDSDNYRTSGTIQ